LLLSLRRMSESLPADDLAALLAFLSRKQLHEQRRLQRLLKSNRYRSLLASWQGFLQDAPSGAPEPADAARPLVQVTWRRFLGLYGRRVQNAIVSHEKTPADAIPQVRMEAKKLRYMIDATRSLHDRRDLDRIIDSLKRVQSVLGDFNDAQVQERN